MSELAKIKASCTYGSLIHSRTLVSLYGPSTVRGGRNVADAEAEPVTMVYTWTMSAWPDVLT